MQELINGAHVIEKTGDIVIAIWERPPKVEYVTWAVDALGNTFSGHYFTNLIDACEDYIKRAKKGY